MIDYVKREVRMARPRSPSTSSSARVGRKNVRVQKPSDLVAKQVSLRPAAGQSPVAKQVSLRPASGQDLVAKQVSLMPASGRINKK